jgi:hypothetical protein
LGIFDKQGGILRERSEPRKDKNLTIVSDVVCVSLWRAGNQTDERHLCQEILPGPVDLMGPTGKEVG